MHESIIIQRALLSVYDKSNIIELAESLHLRGVELLSTGQTAAYLKQHGLPVTAVSDYTGFPEIMDGRVKTLHPKIHGGILGRRDIDADTMLAHQIPDIDLVVVNLYPFQQVISKSDATLPEAIEHIDIGGPTMIRAAAKNYEWCTVLVDPADYPTIITALQESTEEVAIKEALRFQLAAKAFAHVAAYDAVIAQYLQKQAFSSEAVFNSTFSLNYRLKETLRYGENPQQQGAFYQDNQPPTGSIASSRQLQGKPLSYNNILDGDVALECVKSFDQCACVIVKHANPCGVALGLTAMAAYEKAYAADATSAFGGIIAFNHEVNEQLMLKILGQQFVEIIIAPGFTEQAVQEAKQKENCRLLQYTPASSSTLSSWEIRSVNGGILVQTPDTLITPNCEVVTKRAPTTQEMQDLLFSWQVVKWVKSNGIVYAKEGQTLGIGPGQTSRVFSTEIAAMKAQQANLNLKGAVMASDAFFPFKDNIEKAHQYGITAIIQPGGSKKDPEVIACANEFNIAMVLTGQRCFRH